MFPKRTQTPTKYEPILTSSTSGNRHNRETKMNQSLDEEIEYLTSENSKFDAAPSPIKNDYRKDPQMSRTSDDGTRSPSLFTKFPVLQSNENKEEQHKESLSNVYETLFQDDDDTRFSTPVKQTVKNTFSPQPYHSTTNTSEIITESFQSFPTSNNTSPFPKRCTKKETTVESFSTPNAKRIESRSDLDKTDEMEMSDFEKFNVDNIIHPIRESTTKQLKILQRGETLERNDNLVIKQENKHQELFHHYLNEKGDLKNAMLLLNQFNIKQHRMNILNFKLNSINLFANFANAVKSHKLQIELHKSKKHVANLNGKVEDLNSTVVQLNGEVEHHKSTLSSFMQKYYKTVEELQQNQIVQKMQLENIMNLKLKEDITVDLILLIGISYVVRYSKLLNRLLRFAFMFLPFSKIPIIITKLIITIGLLVVSRRLAMKAGIHAGASSATLFIFKGVQFTYQTFRMFWNWNFTKKNN